MTPEHGLDSNFRYVVMAARRARQLQNGSQPLIDSRSNKACRVAQEEIAAGKVKAAPSPGSRWWTRYFGPGYRAKNRDSLTSYNHRYEGHGRCLRRHCCL